MISVNHFVRVCFVLLKEDFLVLLLALDFKTTMYEIFNCVLRCNVSFECRLDLGAKVFVQLSLQVSHPNAFSCAHT